MLGFLHAKKTKRITNAAIATLFVALQLPMAVLFTSTASATPQPTTRTFTPGMFDGADKVPICHSTSSATNPYDSIEPNVSSEGALNGGHNNDASDIIPPYTWNAQGVHPAGSYAGLNWDASHIAIWENDCNALTTVTPTAPTSVNPCGTLSDKYTIPSKTGVIYKIGTNVVDVGTYNNTTPGTVTVTAIADTGYTLTGTTSWDLTFTDISCEILPTTGTLTVHKVTDPADDTTSFPISVSSNNGGTTTGTVPTTVSTTTDAVFTVTPGKFTVTEDLSNLTGWSQSDTTCTDVTVAAGDSKDCTITNSFTTPDTESVTLCHRTDSQKNPYQAITVDASGAYNGHYLEHGGPQSPNNQGTDVWYPGHPKEPKWADIIPTFTYQGHEYSLNWDEAGQAIFNDGTCVPSTPSGSITIIKSADPVTDQSFDFTSNITDNASFSLSGDGVPADNTNEMDGLALDHSYTVTETGVSGWTLQSINCGDAEVTTNMDAHSVTITLSSDQKDVTCTFNNHKSGEVLGSSVGSISGFKFNDLNSNGKWDTNEPGLSGWTIFLDKNSNGTLDSGEVSTVTASNGSYSFTDLDEGTYRVCEVQQTGWTQKLGGSDSGCYDITVNANGTLDWANINFGNNQFLPGRGGQVLGASTTLADTGSPVPVIVSILAGLSVLGIVAALSQASRRRQLS